MRLVGEGAWGEPADPAEARRVLRRAVELGVTLIDTADAYGPEIAERLIAEALYPYPPGLVIATKGGITRQGPAKTEYRGPRRLSDPMRRNEPAPAQARPHRPLPAPPHRPPHPARRVPWRTEADAGRREKSATSASARSLPRRLKRPARSSTSSLSRIDTVWPTAVMRRRSNTASSRASASCPGTPSMPASCSSPTTPRRKRWPRSPRTTRPQSRSFRWPGCCNARR